MTPGEKKRGRPRKDAPIGVKQKLLLRPVLMDVCGGDRGAALLLSQVLNWSIPPDSATDEEFFASNGALMATTGLSEDQFRSARKTLCELGFLHVSKRGAPPRIFYAVRHNILEAAIQALQENGSALA